MGRGRSLLQKENFLGYFIFDDIWIFPVFDGISEIIPEIFIIIGEFWKTIEKMILKIKLAKLFDAI